MQGAVSEAEIENGVQYWPRGLNSVLQAPAIQRPDLHQSRLASEQASIWVAEEAARRL